MSGVVTGFYGKLPARGDFVRVGLPRDFTDPWDEWLQTVLAGSREMMGESWLPVFLEAPVWRFALPAGMCGSQAVLGLMLPSVDHAGRYFPLTFATLGRLGVEGNSADGWLDQCEAAGRAALEQDSPPEEVSGMIGTATLPGNSEGLTEAVWWTDGSARVQPGRMTLRSLPSVAVYAAMLGAETDDTNGVSDESGLSTGGGRWEATS